MLPYNQFRHLALEYLNAAEVLFTEAYGPYERQHDGPTNNIKYLHAIRPIGYLLGHGIEALLKANILQSGETEKYIQREIGHNLVTALRHEGNCELRRNLPALSLAAYAKLNSGRYESWETLNHLFCNHFVRLNHLYGRESNFAYKYPSTSTNSPVRYPRPIFLLIVFLEYLDTSGTNLS